MMSRHHSIHSEQAIKRALFALACLTFGAALFAGDSQLESNSPFLPQGYSTMKIEPPKPPPQVNGPLSRELEFRGIVQMNGVYEFSLFNKKLNRGYWIAENGAESGISVRNFDLASMRITVTQNGRTEQLTLLTATDSPLPVAASAPPMPTNLPQPVNIPGLDINTPNIPSASRVIPRRRVILPKKP